MAELTPVQALDSLCREYEQWAITNAHSMRHPDGINEVLIAATFARGTSTLAAIRALAEKDHGVHAQMMSRSLFEDALTATWIQATEPTDLLERHDAYIYVFRKLARLTTGSEPPAQAVRDALTPRERVLFGNLGTGPWTGASSFKQLQDIARAWGDEPAKEGLLRGLWQYHGVFQRMNNGLIHNTPLGLEAFYKLPDDGPLELIIATHAGESFDALANGLMTYGILLAATVGVLLPAKGGELAVLRDRLLATVDDLRPGALPQA